MSMTVPILCAFNSPSMPNRTQLLERDPMRRASYPRESVEAGKDGSIGVQVTCYSMIVFYAFGVVIWSTRWSV